MRDLGDEGDRAGPARRPPRRRRHGAGHPRGPHRRRAAVGPRRPGPSLRVRPDLGRRRAPTRRAVARGSGEQPARPLARRLRGPEPPRWCRLLHRGAGHGPGRPRPTSPSRSSPGAATAPAGARRRATVAVWSPRSPPRGRAGLSPSSSASRPCSTTSVSPSITVRTTRCRPGTGAVRGDDPRLHLLRPPRVAPALEGGLLPTGHPAGGAPCPRARVRESEPPRSGSATGARFAPPSSWHRTASTTPGSRPRSLHRARTKRPWPASACRRTGRWSSSSGPSSRERVCRRWWRPSTASPDAHPDAVLVLGRAARLGSGRDRASSGHGAPRRPDHPDRVPARRRRPRLAASGRGGGVPGARGGVRAARPRGPGLRGPARDDRRHGDGRDGRGRRPPRPPRRRGRRSPQAIEAALGGGPVDPRRELGGIVAAGFTWEASVALHVAPTRGVSDRR